jgi:hypothetical protein
LALVATLSTDLNETALHTHSLSQEDGTWVSFVTHWRDQARRVEPAIPLNEDAFGVLRSLAAGKLSIVGGSVSKAAVSAFRNNHDGRFYAVCMLNAAHLSGFDEPTFRCAICFDPTG